MATLNEPTDTNVPIAQMRCMRKVLGASCMRAADHAATIVVHGMKEMRTDVIACSECARTMTNVLDLITLEVWNKITQSLRLALPPSSATVRWDAFKDLESDQAIELAGYIVQATIERLVGMRVKTSPQTAGLLFTVGLTYIARFTEDARLDRKLMGDKARDFFYSLDAIAGSIADVGEQVMNDTTVDDDGEPPATGPQADLT